MADELKTRLQLEGAKAVERAWKRIGTVGDDAMRRIRSATGEASDATRRAKTGMDQYTAAVRKAGGASKDLDRGVRSSTERMAAFRSTLLQTTALVGVGFGVGDVVRTFADFDRGLIAVGKTTDLAGADLQALGRDIQELSRDIPVATQEMLGIAEAAGQLGITGSANIVRFTGTLARLQLTSDLVGEEGAKSLARMLNVTGEAISDVDRLGSTITALGNSMAASESEIVDHATSVAQATALYDTGAASATALGATLAALGVRSELAGSSIGRAFAAIDAAIQAGGASARRLSDLTGIAVERLESAFAEDSAAVFRSFVEGLGRIEERGGSVVQTMEQFGLTGEENRKVLGPLAANTSVLADALERSGTAWSENTALTEEALRASESFSAQMQLVENAVDEAAVEIGRDLAPLIADVTADFADWIKEAKDSGELRAMFQTMRPPLEGLASAAELLAKNFDLVVAVSGAYAGLRLARVFQDQGVAALSYARSQVEAIRSIKAKTAAERTNAAATLAKAETEMRAAQAEKASAAAALESRHATLGAAGATVSRRQASMAFQAAALRERAAVANLTAAQSANAVATRAAGVAARTTATAMRALNFVGGPAGLAMLALSFALEGVFAANVEATAAQDRHTESMERAKRLMKELRTASADRAAQIRTENEEARSAAARTVADLERRLEQARAGLSGVLSAAMAGATVGEIQAFTTPDVADLEAALAEARDQLAAYDTIAARAGDTTVETATAADAAAGAQRRLRDSLETTAGQMEHVSDAAEKTSAKIEKAVAAEEKTLGKALKAIGEGYEGVREQMDASLEARLSAIDREAAAEAEALGTLEDERARARQSVEIVRDSSRRKVAAVEDWAARSLRSSEDYYTGIMDLERRAGHDTTDLARESAEDRKAIWGEMEDRYSGFIDTLVAEEKRHADAARAATRAIADDRAEMEQRIRELRRDAMDADDARADREAERRETLAAAEEALETGRYEEAKRLAEEAADLAEENARAVDGSGRQQRRAVAAAARQMEDAATLIEAANRGLAETEQAAAEAVRAQIDGAQQRIAGIRGMLRALEAEIGRTSGRAITLNTAQAEAALTRLTALLADLRQAEAVGTAVTRLGEAIQGLREDAANEPLRLEAKLQAEAISRDLDGLVALAESYDVELPATLQTVQAKAALDDLVGRVDAVGTAIEAVPPVSVQIDEGAAAAAERRLDAVARDRTATIRTVMEGGDDAEHRARGGLMRGPGGPTADRIPAMLSDYEYVVRAAAVRKFGVGFFDALNAGRMPQGFAEGGLASGGAVFTMPDLPALRPPEIDLPDPAAAGRAMNLYFGDGRPVPVTADSGAVDALLRSGLFQTVPPRRR